MCFQWATGKVTYYLLGSSKQTIYCRGPPQVLI